MNCSKFNNMIVLKGKESNIMININKIIKSFKLS